MPRYYLPTFFLIAAASCTSHAFAADPLTLAEAMRIAGAQPLRVQAQDAAVAAAEADASAAGALPDPMLVFGIENLPVTGGDALDPPADDMTMKQLGLRQEFPAAGKRSALRTLAQRQVDVARAQAVVERLSVRRAAADAWITAWAVDHEVHALEQLREQARLAAKLARARAGGGGSLSEALAAEAAGLELDNQLEEAKARRESALAALRRWVPGTYEVAMQDPDFEALPLTQAQLLARLDELAPLLGGRARAEKAAAAIDVARAEKRSDWSITAAYGQRDRDRSDMLSVEVEIALPWFQRGRTGSGVLAREAEYQQALALRDDERRALTADIEAAYLQWEALKRQVALHEDRLLPIARDRSAAALAAYRAGGELQPWLDARDAELQVHRSHAEHLGELGHAWAALAFLVPETTP